MAGGKSPGSRRHYRRIIYTKDGDADSGMSSYSLPFLSSDRCGNEVLEKGV